MIHYADYDHIPSDPPTTPMELTWVGNGKTATKPPNPDYPNGVVVNDPNLKEGDLRCQIPLPYPAAGVGYWKVKCTKCGLTVACPAAGRVDDPRIMVIRCKNQPT